MPSENLQELVDAATFEFTLAEHGRALVLLDQALDADPSFVPAWHAKAEIHFDLRELNDALAAAEQALQLQPDDVHLHTSLSRIWMERGDKAKAEHHGAQARVMGWKAELQDPPEDD